MEHLGPGFEQSIERRTVLFQRNVEHCYPIAGRRPHSVKQLNVALDTGDEHRLTRRGQAQLGQRADTVGVAIEHIVMGHASVLAWGARRPAERAIRADGKPAACTAQMISSALSCAITRSAAPSTESPRVSSRNSGVSGAS